MADQVSSETFEYTIAGRKMTFKHIKRGQLMMVQRLSSLNADRIEELRKAENFDEAMRLSRETNNMVWLAIESLFTSLDDLMHVQSAILRGDIDDTDVTPLLYGGYTDTAPDDAEPQAKPVRKKAAKKPAAKAVRRAQR